LSYARTLLARVVARQSTHHLPRWALFKRGPWRDHRSTHDGGPPPTERVVPPLSGPEVR